MKPAFPAGMLIGALLILTPLAAHADKKVVESATVAPATGASTTGEVTTWIGNQRFARIDSVNKNTTIVRKDRNRMYLVSHARREVTEIELPYELPDYLRPLFSEVAMTWELNRLPENRRIGQWNCTRVLLHGRGTLSIEIELWVTPETGIDTRAFHAMAGESLAASPIYRTMAEKMSAIAPNFAIRTSVTIQHLGLKSTTSTEVKSIIEAVAPAGTYEPPAGYAVKPLDFSTYLSMIRERQPGPGAQ
jgi:hypothetical protein